MSIEERQTIEDYVLEHPKHPNRQIAAALGNSPTTIRRMRQRLCQEQECDCRNSASAPSAKKQELPVSETRLFEIARQCGLKYFRDDHPEYEEFVQEILLGVLERQHEYDPTRDKADLFVISVARQKARNRMEERRAERESMYRNHRSRIPYPMKHREAGEADEHGRLRFTDHDLCMKRLESILPSEPLELLRLLKEEWSESKIRAKTGWNREEFQRHSEELKMHAKKIFQKNIFSTSD